MVHRFEDRLGGYVQLTTSAVAALAKATASPKSYPPKYHLIREGDPTGPVFVLFEGWAFRYKVMPGGSRHIVGFLMPGDACDLNDGFDNQMDHSIQTITHTVVAKIERDHMYSMMRRHRSIERAMYVSQLVGEATSRAWITCLSRRSSLERLAHLLSELYIRARHNGIADDGKLALPFTQVLLAEATGMTSVHANRVLKELRESGAIQVERQSLVITDIGKLVRLAGFDDSYIHRRIPRVA